MRLHLVLLGCALTHSAAAFELPNAWVHGAANEPSLQVHQAAPGTWILRQSKGSHFEAPFIYLLAGSQSALLLDTGAEPVDGRPLPLRAEIDRLLSQWQRDLGLASLPLVVAHTHGHGDHWGGDAQFADRRDTRIVGVDVRSVREFFDLKQWPAGESTWDLGQRELVVLPLPGHQDAHIAVYDPQTQSLFSGDSINPGLITIRDLPAFNQSIERLVSFAQTHPVQRYLGAHIEMSNAPGALYPIGERMQPDEHSLSVSPESVAEVAATLKLAGDFRHREPHASMVLTQIIKPETIAAEVPSTHGMLLFGERQLWLSHLPMFHPAHAWQAIAQVELSARMSERYRADKRDHPGSIYTVVPTSRWPLVGEFKRGKRIEVDLYRGHFERGGERLIAGVSVLLSQIVHLRALDAGDQSGNQWLRFGVEDEQFVARRIGGAGDFDQLLSVTGEHESLRTQIQGPDRPLQVGDRIGSLTVRKLLYTEHNDLQ